MARFTPVQSNQVAQAPSSPQPSPGGGGINLAPAQLGAGLLSSGARLVGQPDIASAGQGLGAGLNVMRGVQQIGQGQPVPGSISLLAGAGQGMQAGQRFLPVGAGTVGGALGGAAGLAGSGFSLAQGNIPGGVQGLLSSGGALANLAPASWAVGGVPLSAAGGAATGGLAASEAGIGLGSGSAMTGASLAGAGGALSIPFAVGSAVENAVNALFGQGAYAQTKLPFNRNARFSSADNLASQTSQFTSLRGANALRSFIEKAPDTTSLFSAALGGPKLSPNGEIQFYLQGPNGETWSGGKGGSQQTPTDPRYEAVVRAAYAGDPNALRQFIGGIHVQSGESGAGQDDYQLTDWYRRKLTSLLPEATRAQLGNVGSLFEPTPAKWAPEGLAQQTAQDYLQMAQQSPGGGYTPEALRAGLLGLTGGHQGGLTPLYRGSADQLAPGRVDSVVADYARELASAEADRQRWAETYATGG